MSNPSDVYGFRQMFEFSASFTFSTKKTNDCSSIPPVNSLLFSLFHDVIFYFFVSFPLFWLLPPTSIYLSRCFSLICFLLHFSIIFFLSFLQILIFSCFLIRLLYVYLAVVLERRLPRQICRAYPRIANWMFTYSGLEWEQDYT